MKFLEGNPLTVEQARTLGILLRPCDRLPKILGDTIANKVCLGHTESIRLVLTVLVASRALTLGTDPDFTTIESPVSNGCQVTDLVSKMEVFSQQF